jgi:hypothetical protein
VKAAAHGHDILGRGLEQPAAMRRPLSRTSTEVRTRAPPPSTTLRLPKVPKPSGPERVSPCMTVTSSGVTPR